MNDTFDDDLDKAVDDLLDALVRAARLEYNSKPVPTGPPTTDTDAKDPTDEEILSHFDWVKPTFEEFGKPVPSDFDPLIKKMKQVEVMFGTSEDVSGDTRLENIDTAKNYIQASWRGMFGTALVEDFFSPLELVRANHGVMAACLRKNAEAMRAVYANGRTAALDIAKKGTTALDAIRPDTATGLAVFLGVATAVQSLLVPLLPSKLSVQIASAVISGGLGTAGKFTPDKTEEVELGAAYVWGVMDNVKKALEKARKNIEADEQRIIKALNTTDDTVNKLMQRDDQTTGVPVFANRPKTFDPTDADGGLIPTGNSA
ncbi:MAG TPA: hypothetical protein VE172_09515 [Stackebrandtia sp.]|jgi:hypothetical protein|uniref:hypothetical protein n=1 Tax=Stackebrandtia sp. TaxID=2023065 RepID=UPI002D4C6D75|nr:hypothetical protein [Stackebrandtia sp.]HZE39033.1 hypothetical protein [Stackebrandtia sp.]